MYQKKGKVAYLCPWKKFPDHKGLNLVNIQLNDVIKVKKKLFNLMMNVKDAFSKSWKFWILIYPWVIWYSSVVFGRGCQSVLRSQEDTPHCAVLLTRDVLWVKCYTYDALLEHNPAITWGSSIFIHGVYPETKCSYSNKF